MTEETAHDLLAAGPAEDAPLSSVTEWIAKLSLRVKRGEIEAFEALLAVHWQARRQEQLNADRRVDRLLELRAERGRGAGRVKLDPGYVACCERLGRHIQEWCGCQERLPDLKFYDHGSTMIGAALEPLTYGLLARTPDAFALLEYLDAREPEATIFLTRMALETLGFLAGAEVLSVSQIKSMMARKGALVEFGKGAGSIN